MSEVRTIHVLLVMPWTEDIAPIERALRTAGLDVAVQRVDFEASLHAALARGPVDVIVVDEDTPGMSLETVRRACALYPLETAILARGALATLAARVHAAVPSLAN